MTHPLHKAIYDALKDPAYADKGILVTTILEATQNLDADESLLYRAVYTIFRALPGRLLPGTTLAISTFDLPEGGIELTWEGRERIEPEDAGATDLRSILGQGPHGDLVEIAILALQRYCNMRAGHLDSRRDKVGESSSFARPAHIVRRVVAVIPATMPSAGATSSLREAEDATTTPGRAAKRLPEHDGSSAMRLRMAHERPLVARGGRRSR